MGQIFWQITWDEKGNFHLVVVPSQCPWKYKTRSLGGFLRISAAESPLDCKEIQPVHPKGNQSWIFIGRTLATWYKELTHLKRPDAGKDWRQEEEGTTEDEMVGWHHRLNGHELEQALGVGDGQGSLACCSPWGCKESDTTEWLNWNETPSGASLPPTTISPLYVVTEHWVGLAGLYTSFPLTTYFTHDSVYMSVLLSQFLPPSPSPVVSTSPFSISASPLLPCT